MKTIKSKIAKIKRKTAPRVKKAVKSLDGIAHSKDVEIALDKLLKRTKIPFRASATNWTKSRSRRVRVQRKAVIAVSAIGVVALLAYIQTQLPVGPTAKVAIKGLHIATSFVSA